MGHDGSHTHGPGGNGLIKAMAVVGAVCAVAYVMKTSPRADSVVTSGLIWMFGLLAVVITCAIVVITAAVTRRMRRPRVPLTQTRATRETTGRMAYDKQSGLWWYQPDRSLPPSRGTTVEEDLMEFFARQDAVNAERHRRSQ